MTRTIAIRNCFQSAIRPAFGASRACRAERTPAAPAGSSTFPRREKNPPPAALSADHFETDPDEINRDHVGTLNLYRAKLHEITDMPFREGEHTE
jgi:hypothetical protein